MAERGETDIRRLLDRLDHGDRAALDELFPCIYDELSEVAHRLRPVPGRRMPFFAGVTVDETATLEQLAERFLPDALAAG